jgi:Flp pilus assembly protein TadB
MGFIDYYELLQVSPRADAEVIDRAYRTLMSKHHPDKGGDTLHAQRLNEAHDVIGDPKKRAAYNREWAGHQRRTSRSPKNASPEGAAVSQTAPDRRQRPSAWAASWVAGVVLVLLGVAFLATGSAFVGLLLAAVGMVFIFNLSGLWLLVALMAVGAGIIMRYALRARRSASYR